MLDDLKYIHAKDPQDALGFAAKQWQQLTHEFDIPTISKPQNVVFAGMGGSALGALISESWPGYDVPFQVVRDYTLPAYVGPNTLVISSSYSGNTEEAVSCLEEAIAAKASVVVLAGGGRLQEIAEQNGLPLVLLPKAGQPRYAVFYALKALVGVLVSSQLIDAKEADKEIAAAAKFLESEVLAWLPDVPAAKNPAKQLAREVVGKTPVVYAGGFMAPAAYKWKISFNENAKNIAWWGQYPEFNHNEFIGWSSHPVEKPYEIIDLRSRFEHERTQKRMPLSDKLLSGRRPKAHLVEARGETRLQHMLWTIAFGDFVTLYTALLNGVNPMPVDLVEKFKKELSS